MFQSLQNHLQLSHAKEMGYHNEEKFAQALNAFKSKNTLIEWFDSRFYDLVHFPTELLFQSLRSARGERGASQRGAKERGEDIFYPNVS